MKVKIDWKHVALLAFVAILLLYITKSFFMSLGIMMILLLIDALLAQWEDNRKNKDRFKNSGKTNPLFAGSKRGKTLPL